MVSNMMSFGKALLIWLTTTWPSLHALFNMNLVTESSQQSDGCCSDACAFHYDVHERNRTFAPEVILGQSLIMMSMTATEDGL